jgi:predicted metal-dependent hydrolase
VFARGIVEYARRDFHPRQNDNYALAAAYLEKAGLEPRAEAA